MLAHRFRNDLVQFFYANNIGQKEVGNDKCQKIEHKVFDGPPRDLAGSPGGCFIEFLLRRTPFNKIFNFPEQHFHKHRLGTNPAAKQPAKGCGEQDDENDEGDHSQPEDEKILGPEHLSENNESGGGDIEKKQRPAIDINKGQGNEQGKEAKAHCRAQVVQSAHRLLGIYPVALSARIYGSDPVPERFLSCFLYHGLGRPKGILVSSNCYLNYPLLQLLSLQLWRLLPGIMPLAAVLHWADWCL